MSLPVKTGEQREHILHTSALFNRLRSRVRPWPFIRSFKVARSQELIRVKSAAKASSTLVLPSTSRYTLERGSRALGDCHATIRPCPPSSYFARLCLVIITYEDLKIPGQLAMPCMLFEICSKGELALQ